MNNAQKSSESIKINNILKKKYKIYEYFFSPVKNSDFIHNSDVYTSSAQCKVLSFQVLPLLSEFKDYGLSFHVADNIYFDTELESIIKSLKNRFEPLTIGISTSLIGTISELMQITGLIKKYFTNSRLILGGTKTSVLSSNLSEKDLSCFHSIVPGDGEKIYPEIIYSCKKNLDIQNSVYFKNKINNTFFMSSETNCKDLDNMRLLSPDCISQNINSVFIEGARGCPFKCAYCRYPNLTEGYRIRSAENIADIVKKFNSSGIYDFYFFDSTFSTPSDRLKKFCDILIYSDLHINWYCFVRASDITQEIATKMKRSGCRIAYIGIESTDNNTLDIINKKVTISQIKKAIDILHNNEIIVFGSFIIGLPENNSQTPHDIIDFIKHTELEVCDIYPLAIEPDTPFYNNSKEFGYIIKESSDFSTPDWENKNMNASQADLMVNNLLFEIEKNEICLTYSFLLSIGIDSLFKDADYAEYKKLFRILRMINSEIIKNKPVSLKNIYLIKNVRKIIKDNTHILEKFFIINKPSQSEIWSTAMY